jgi:hypothetical protein
MGRAATIIFTALLFLAVRPSVHGQDAMPAGTAEEQAQDQPWDQLTPEQRMARRFPQPVRVGHLIGLPVLDFDDSTIGYVRDVVRTGEGKIELIVPYNPWFGWVWWNGSFDLNRRPVAVPIETVVILARQLDALDMKREDFDVAPTFVSGQTMPIPRDDVIRIGIGRR